MVVSSGTKISFDEGLDSLNRKPIAIIVTKDRINAARTGNIDPKIVPPKFQLMPDPE